MNRVMNYIKNGQGYGIKYLAFISIIFILIFGGTSYWSFSALIQSADVKDFINDIPVMSFDHKEMLEPTDTYYEKAVPFIEDTFFVLDTKNAEVNLAEFEKTLYLTTDKIYLKAMGDIQVYDYDAGLFMVTPELLYKLLQVSTIVFVALFAMFSLIIIWVGYLFLYLLGWVYSGFSNKAICPKMRGRLVYVCWSTVLLMYILLAACGVYFSISLALLWAFIAMLLGLYQLPTHSAETEAVLTHIEKKSKDNSKKKKGR